MLSVLIYIRKVPPKAILNLYFDNGDFTPRGSTRLDEDFLPPPCLVIAKLKRIY